ncbi:Transposon Tf2-12 polyprotein [Vitis vinifera]|uniref:Transposon Tf2-12 polyprotein n=1 Tax=Vitis vinifera TaxID=29760 RepID=A0A438EJS6_VITVI|nr:Transposon Tf2-12 polyprotein [Vitis vinifera]
MTKIFKPLIGHTVEVYIDDIVVKSKTREQHDLHLQEVFHLLRRYGMKLNPSKCAFGVSAGKFLGFMISQRGIEVSPDQVKAVIETPPPRNKKELQRLTCKLVALGRFIARFTDELRLFFLAIRKAGTHGWTDNCQNALERIKQWAISAVLFRCPSPKEQKPVYYVSRALADVETRFNWANATMGHRIERIWNRIPTQIIQKRPSNGRLRARIFTKTQPAPRISEQEWWTLRVDGASRSSGSGVGLLLQSPTGEHLEQAIRLGFSASNNEAEYEAILSGLDLALALSVSKLRIYSDSQLVVRHVQKEYEAKDSRMARYLAKVRSTLQQFTEWTIEKIKRADNGALTPWPNISGQALYPKILNKRTKSGNMRKSYGRTIPAHRAHSQGYYWPTMKKDAAAYVQKCDKCQRYAPIPHMPSAALKSVSGPWPFAQWGMDIVGPLPAAPAQKKFLLVATDYFSKWVEAEAYASIKDKDVTKFAEATNKTLINALKKRLEQAKGKWVEELPGVLWAYRTTPGRPTGNTPFALTYGMDAVIPTEIGLPTIRRCSKTKDANTELGRNLDWADEVRESAAIRMADYQQRASAHYNRKVRPRNFKNGTLVLRKVFENTAEVGAGKFQANWEGPYIVSKANENGAYHLQKLDGTPLLRPWNVSNLKQYYQ